MHQGAAAPSAEALMRSRYVAYVLGLESYLRATWHPRTCPAELDLAVDQAATKWLGLEVRACNQADQRHATVEFVARCRVAGRGQRLHEISRFERLDGQGWVYVDGEFPARESTID